MLYIPLTTNPVGWLILGASGYALYKAGKKRGTEEAAASQIPQTSESETMKKAQGEKK